MAEEGGFLNAPDIYMDKIAIGPGLPDGLVDLDAEPEENLKQLAKAKKMDIADLVACILDRPRHSELIARVRAAGARIMLISDGDVSGVISTARPDSGVDIYMGSGGAPEGVLAAAALRCIGGQMQGRLIFRNDDERGRARRLGITDFNRKYGLHRPRAWRRDVRGHRCHRRRDAEGRAPFHQPRNHPFHGDAFQVRHCPGGGSAAQLDHQAAGLAVARSSFHVPSLSSPGPTPGHDRVRAGGAQLHNNGSRPGDDAMRASWATLPG